MGNSVLSPISLSFEELLSLRNPQFSWHTCLAAATIPRPQTYWQAITEPNLMSSTSTFFLDLFINKTLSAERYNSANWTQQGLDYRKLLQTSGIDLNHSIPFMNNLQVASFTFVISMIFRVMQIISTNFLNKIDTLKWNATTKLLASSAAIVLPYLFMQYVCDWPMSELIIASQVQNLLIFGLSYLNMGWSNTLREFNVLSNTRNFNFFGVFSRGFLSSAINLFATISSDLHILSNLEGNFIGDSAGLFICYKYHSKPNELAAIPTGVPINQKDAILARYFTNELGWLLGRYLVDLSVSALHTIGLIKDLRDPLGLLGGKPEKPAIILQRPQLAESYPKSLAAAAAVLPPAKMKSGEEGAKTSDYRAEYAVAAPAEKPKKTPSGIRKALAARPSSAAHEAIPAPAPALDIIRPDIIDIPNYHSPLVKLHGKSINHDTYGAVIYNRISGFESFITALRTGHVGEGAAIKSIGNRIFEIRPTNTGDRLIGKEEDFDKTAKRLLPLGAAIEFDRTHNPDGTLKAVPFTTRVKHERITQGIAAASKEL